MRPDYTHITLVVDRSGSMNACRTDAEGGVNAFIADQQKQSGKATFTLVQFSTDYQVLADAVPIKNVHPYTLSPSGGTALNDAVGRAIDETGTFLAKLPEDARPALVSFVIVTDGEENSSRKFSTWQVREMIKHQTEKYSWVFDYLSAKPDAFRDAEALGIPATSFVQTGVRFIGAGYEALSAKTSRTRSMASIGGDTSSVTYSQEERETAGGIPAQTSDAGNAEGSVPNLGQIVTGATSKDLQEALRGLGRRPAKK